MPKDQSRVLHRLAQGKLGKQIANDLGCSRDQLTRVKRKIFEVFGVETAVAALGMGLRYKCLDRKFCLATLPRPYPGQILADVSDTKIRILLAMGANHGQESNPQFIAEKLRLTDRTVEQHKYELYGFLREALGEGSPQLKLVLLSLLCQKEIQKVLDNRRLTL